MRQQVNMPNDLVGGIARRKKGVWCSFLSVKIFFKKIFQKRFVQTSSARWQCLRCYTAVKHGHAREQKKVRCRLLTRQWKGGCSEFQSETGVIRSVEGKKLSAQSWGTPLPKPTLTITSFFRPQSGD